MSTLDGGCDYQAAPGPQPGRHYMFTTLRAHLPGGYIPAHFDDEQAARPSYRHLLQLVQLKLFSFVVAFSQAEEGGVLEIFDLKPQSEGQRIATNDRSSAKPNLDAVERVSFRLGTGRHDYLQFRTLPSSRYAGWWAHGHAGPPAASWRKARAPIASIAGVDGVAPAVPRYFDLLIEGLRVGQSGRDVHLGYWDDRPSLDVTMFARRIHSRPGVLD